VVRNLIDPAVPRSKTFALMPRLIGRVLAACVLAALFVVPCAPSLAASKVAPLAAEEALLINPQQATLLQEQFSALPPQQPGVTDVYAIGVAGWAQEDVFLKELNGALASIQAALPLRGTVRLINQIETARTIPLASRQNFAAAVHAVAGVMNKDEDVLLLFITSHGSTVGVGLQLPGVTVPLAPAEIAAVLKKEGIKNRVVIVSACYSGIFIKPLGDTNSIVLTASDEKSPSFGCASGREWTYFGDAFFHHSLQPGSDFKAAFTRAKTLVQGWEKKEKLHPSNPQGRFGKAITAKLAPLFGANPQ
jgi:hypothetical protein